MAIKKGHVMLGLLIPEKYKVKNMDVYLQPMIDELQILWQGIHVEDISRPIGQRHFEARAILMWTMHDFPGYGECSGIVPDPSIYIYETDVINVNIYAGRAGLSTSGYHACPRCGDSIVSTHSPHLKRVVYENHHRFLPPTHPKYKPPKNLIKLVIWTSSDWKKKWEQHAEGPTHIPGMSRLVTSTVNGSI